MEDLKICIPAVPDGFVRIVRQLAGAPVPGEGRITKAKEREVR